jgi:hypothetical protein
VIDLSKKETPEVQNKYLELEKDDLVNEVVQIKEALTASKVDIHSALGLEKAENKTIDNSSSIEALTGLRSQIGEKIIALGGKIETISVPQETEAEKKIYVEIEKLQQSQLDAKKAAVQEIDADFPTDVIENAQIPTEQKVTLMGSMIDVASRTVKAVDKVKVELDATVDEKSETAKFSTPDKGETKEEEVTGKSYLSEIKGKLNFSDDLTEQKQEAEVKA